MVALFRWHLSPVLFSCQPDAGGKGKGFQGGKGFAGGKGGKGFQNGGKGFKNGGKGFQNGGMGGKGQGFMPNQQPQQQMAGNALFVGNLAWNVNVEELRTIFGPFNLINAEIKTGFDGTSKGYGIVRVGNPQSAQAAIGEYLCSACCLSCSLTQLVAPLQTASTARKLTEGPCRLSTTAWRNLLVALWVQPFIGGHRTRPRGHKSQVQYTGIV